MCRKPRATPSKSCPAPTAAAKWAKSPASTPRRNSAPTTSSPLTRPTTSASSPNPDGRLSDQPRINTLHLFSLIRIYSTRRSILTPVPLLVIERLLSLRQTDSPRSRPGVESASRGNNDEHFSDSPCGSLHLRDWLSLLQRLHRCQGPRPG